MKLSCRRHKTFVEATDALRKPFAAKPVMSSKATVLPVRFEGRNSRLFHAASHIGEFLLISEASRRLGKPPEEDRDYDESLDVPLFESAL